MGTDDVLSNRLNDRLGELPGTPSAPCASAFGTLKIDDVIRHDRLEEFVQGIRYIYNQHPVSIEFVY
jgi:hypothetical protein